MKWINTHGRHGWWTTMVVGHSLKIVYSPAAKKHYRITTRYSTEMFEHQFYTTLKEAQEASVRMFKRHLKIRKAHGYKGVPAG